MSKSWDDCNQGRCRIQINNILVCSDKHKKFTDEYEMDNGAITNIKDKKEYKLEKGVTIVNKLSCDKCCDSDDDDDD